MHTDKPEGLWKRLVNLLATNSVSTKLTLSSKSLILVCLPLCFELIFVLILFGLLQSADAELRQIDDARRVIVKADSVAGNLFAAGQLLNVYDKTGSPMLLPAFKSRIESVKDALKDLKRVFSQSATQSRAFQDYEKLCRHVLSVLEESAAILETGKSDFPYVNDQGLVEEIRLFGSETIKYQELMLAEARDFERNSTARKVKVRAEVSNALFVGLIASSALSILLAFIFNLSTTRRLKILMDNTQKLASSEPLLKPVGGADEIGILDRTFHQMAEALKESDEMKQKFVGMITHDLRTPLSAIRAGLEILESGVGGSLNDKGQKVVNGSLTNADRMIRLIDELLTVQRMESGLVPLELEQLDISDILEKSIREIEELAVKAHIEIKYQPRNSSIYADAERLSQVLINLLSNAIKFSPQISTIEIICQTDENWVEVRISDQGPGIADSERNLIFARFKQVGEATQRSKGFGLGLSICKSIIEQHGGQIGVISEIGKGSTFWFKLPRMIETVETGETDATTPVS